MEDGDVLHPALRALDAVTGDTLAQLATTAVRSRASASRRWLATPGWRSRGSWAASAGRGCGMRGMVELHARRDRARGRYGARGLVAGRVGPPAAGPRGRTAATGTTSAARACTALDTEPGSITAAAVRPDGEVWYRGHRGEHPARLLRVGGDKAILRPRVRMLPPAGRWTSGGSRTRAASESTASRSPRRARRHSRSCSVFTAAPSRSTWTAGPRTCRPTSMPASWWRWSTTAARRASARPGATR